MVLSPKHARCKVTAPADRPFGDSYSDAQLKHPSLHFEKIIQFYPNGLNDHTVTIHLFVGFPASREPYEYFVNSCQLHSLNIFGINYSICWGPSAIPTAKYWSDLYSTVPGGRSLRDWKCAPERARVLAPVEARFEVHEVAHTGSGWVRPLKRTTRHSGSEKWNKPLERLKL